MDNLLDGHLCFPLFFILQIYNIKLLRILFNLFKIFKELNRCFNLRNPCIVLLYLLAIEQIPRNWFICHMVDDINIIIVIN